MMEVARTSETLVNFYQITRRYNPEDSYLRTHRRENLKSYLKRRMVFLTKMQILGALINVFIFIVPVRIPAERILNRLVRPSVCTHVKTR
jgi:hypothetical protein